MRVYLAASWMRRSEAIELADELIMSGVEITSRWLKEQHAPPGGGREKFVRECAFQDVADVRRCDLFVRLADDLNRSLTVPARLATGARMFEQGLAFALGIPIAVVGGRQMIFDNLPSITHLKDKEELKRFLSPVEVN